ncbi:MAG: succinate dehydrogenase, hydrophobic membrane anchor protein [Sulfuritalea sp.]|nr:succinate dehydrogenase, hydrophobic membrane anchor protein [Sulfuritalea sp.]
MNRTVVGAHYGLKDWLAQRVTAVAMAAYALFMAAAVFRGAGEGFEGWRATMGNGFVRFATFLFIVSLCWHAWIGVRDIWMDYVKPAELRLTLHALTILILVGNAGWATRILWSLP